MEHAIKAYKGVGMEGRIARWYATQTSRSMEEYRTLARRIARQIPRDARVLEVAPGPGYFSIELARLGEYRITGLDISHTFVEIARRNAMGAGAQVDFREGNAAAMPFDGGSFDFLLCRAAFKNFSEPVRALQEMHRVLAPGGRGLIIDLRRDASSDSIRDAVNAMQLGAMNRIFTKLTFRFMLLKRAYTRSDLERFVAQTQFDSVGLKEDPVGYELWLERTK